MELPKKVRIREVGPREGFQIIQKTYSTEEKAGLVNILSESGLKEIEVTSFVRKDKVPQMADAESLVELIKKIPGVTYTGLYLNPEGFKRAESVTGLNNQAWISLACSDTFLKKNANTTLEEELSKLPLWLAAFRERKKPLHGLMLSTAFGCAYEGVFDENKVLKVVGKVVTALSAHNERLIEVCLADTVGMGKPAQVEKAITALKSEYPSLYLSMHLHDTESRGLENAECALNLGIDCFDTSIGGIGGCPFTKGAKGNIATEELNKLLVAKGVKTGLIQDRLEEGLDYIRSVLRIDLNSRVK